MEKDLKVGDIVTSVYGWIGVIASLQRDRRDTIECKPAVNDNSTFLKQGYLTDPRPSTEEEIAKFNKIAKEHGYFYKGKLIKFSDEI